MLEAITKIQEMAEAGNVKVTGLDDIPYIVQGRPLFDFAGIDKDTLSAFGQTEDDLYQADGNFNIALFPDGRVEGLKIVSDQYQVVQHYDAILGVFENLPEHFDLQSLEIGTNPSGGRCFAKFTSGQSIEVDEGDKINYQLLMENSGDTSKRLSLKGGAWRLICSNGMRIPDNRIEQVVTKKLHKGSLSLKGEILSFMEIMDESIESMGMWKEYVNKKITAPQLEEVFTALEVGPRVQDELLELGLRGDNTSVQNELQNNRLTAWNLYNAFTQRITDSEALESVKTENGNKVAKYFDSLVAH